MTDCDLGYGSCSGEGPVQEHGQMFAAQQVIGAERARAASVGDTTGRQRGNGRLMHAAVVIPEAGGRMDRVEVQRPGQKAR